MVAYGYTIQEIQGYVHAMHMLEGYRGFVCNEPNPYDEESQPQPHSSWVDGWDQAKNDLEYYHPGKI